MYLSEKIYEPHSRVAVNHFFFKKRNVYSQNNKDCNKNHSDQSIKKIHCPVEASQRNQGPLQKERWIIAN
jgi:hypothetical protein